jgi:excisionase family DNA binding protein
MAKVPSTSFIEASNQSFWTVRQLATRLGISERSARDLVARGVIPSYKIGGSRRIDPADVPDALAACRTSGSNADGGTRG